jgi:N-acetylmuramoyl-L-alanine amidase
MHFWFGQRTSVMFRHRTSPRRVAAMVLAPIALAGAVACRGTPSAPGADGGAPAPGVPLLARSAERLLDPSTALPGRAEVVVLADQLALCAERESGADRARLLRLSADLRARSWRVGHAEADAREAMELYTAALRPDSLPSADDACRAALGHAEIASELARDPVLYWREAYVSAKVVSSPDCASAFSGILRSLAAYRPSPEVVGQLDKEAERRWGELAQARAAQSGRLVSSDETGLTITPTTGLAMGRSKVVSIAPYSSTDRARIVITLNAPAQFNVGALAAGAGAGPRLFVDLDRTNPPSRPEIAASGLVERIRIARRGDGTRIALDLAEPAYRRVFFLPEPFRIIVDVATHPPDRSAPAAGAARRLDRIALDPGHGGSDPGATGPSGLREKDVTLDIAHRAAPILSRELGILTLLTRDDDRAVLLDERTARANAFHADLLVSIHCNASETSTARGAMTFVLDTTRDESATRIAARENATSLAAVPEVGTIAADLRLSYLGARSTHLAELLQRSTMASLSERFRDVPDQGVKMAGFFVLVGAEMPGVLFETSFISNPTEEKLLATAEYRQKLADAIVNAIRAYRDGR